MSMFKNLKKKIEDGGTDLSSLSAISSSIGSSMSSLRRSGSKASSLSHSRESVQSESLRGTVLTTSPIVDDDPPRKLNFNEPSVGGLSQLAETDAVDCLPSISDGAEDSPSAVNTVTASTEQKETESATPNDDQLISSSTDWFPEQDDFVDFTSAPPPATENVLNLVEESGHDLSPVLQPTSTTPDLQRNGDQSSEMNRPPCDHAAFEKQIEALKRQLSEKSIEEKVLQRKLATQESDRASFRAELDRLKDIASQNRSNEEKLRDANAKLIDLKGQLEIVKPEIESWKMAHDQAIQQLKDRTSALQSVQKKNADLESKCSAASAAAGESRKESERLRDENSSLKSTIAVLEKQVDKFITDSKEFKATKERAGEEVRQLQEEVASGETRITELEQELRQVEDNLRKETAAKETALEQSRDVAQLRETIKALETKLIKNQQQSEEAARKLQDSHESEVTDLREQMASNDDVLQGATDELRRKNEIISELESASRELEARLKSLQEDLESKEASLAVFRRRSAKDTEIKLRERDKQIASLEKRLEEEMGRVNTVGLKDDTNNEYTKNVVLKFLSATGEERVPLIRPVAVLLQMTEAEETWLREVIAWKSQWLPGPKPELLGHIVTPSHSHSNGNSNGF
ncbi:hypothetical protein BV898_08125 [Hypsibius exemplaris]|uniref:GRIP domain-containing protein n=1 Tax=Hypsibius exemplaris TaxID=2072580 RepID=A0A1W0WRJ2_HYPEX|nr:hypothetical protein BV898_08125 [Hypsibius exemplaris]